MKRLVFLALMLMLASPLLAAGLLKPSDSSRASTSPAIRSASGGSGNRTSGRAGMSTFAKPAPPANWSPQPGTT